MSDYDKSHLFGSEAKVKKTAMGNTDLLFGTGTLSNSKSYIKSGVGGSRSRKKYGQFPLLNADVHPGTPGLSYMTKSAGKQIFLNLKRGKRTY